MCACTRTGFYYAAQTCSDPADFSLLMGHHARTPINVAQRTPGYGMWWQGLNPGSCTNLSKPLVRWAISLALIFLCGWLCPPWRQDWHCVWYQGMNCGPWTGALRQLSYLTGPIMQFRLVLNSVWLVLNSVCNPDWSWSHNDPIASVFWVLRLQACATASIYFHSFHYHQYTSDFVNIHHNLQLYLKIMKNDPFLLFNI